MAVRKNLNWLIKTNKIRQKQGRLLIFLTSNKKSNNLAQNKIALEWYHKQKEKGKNLDHSWIKTNQKLI